MGGTIAVTIREPNGKEHRMARWTNATPWFINNMGLINKDPKHLAEYQSQWNEMRKDWLDHLKKCKKKEHGSCDFEYNMTPCYAPHTELSPAGYGLVVVDMQRNVILSCQGYTQYGRMLLGSISGKEDWEAARGLFEAGRIKKALLGFEKEIPVPKTFQKLRSAQEKSRELLVIEIDLSPFKIIEIPERDYRALKKEVLKLGFTLSAEEEKTWAEAIKESEEMDA